MTHFVDYVYSFYGPGGIYDRNATKDQIITAFQIYVDRMFDAQKKDTNYYNWGGGDTLDRERVRDILCEQFHLREVNPS